MSMKKFVAVGCLGVAFGILIEIAPTMQTRILAFLMWFMFLVNVIMPKGDRP